MGFRSCWMHSRSYGLNPAQHDKLDADEDNERRGGQPSPH
jgi:hypothetical protein